MTRHRRVAASSWLRRFWWVAALLLSLGVVVITAPFIVVRTEYGRAWLLARAIDSANGVFDGRGALRAGTLRAFGLHAIVVEDVALLDTAGVAVVAAERLQASLSWKALMRRAIVLDDVKIDGLLMDLRQDAPGSLWNVAYIIAGDTMPSTPSIRPGFGDDIRINSVTIAGGRITTVAPWEPHPVFTGAARDSVVAARDSLHDLTEAGRGRWYERRVVTLDRAKAHDVVVVDPLNRPSSLDLDSLRGSISDPPVPVVQARGRVTWTSDSLSFDLPQVVLPASEGRAVGTVSWDKPGPVRFDVNVEAAAGLADLTWVWDVLPADGNGRAKVRMRTLDDPDDMDFLLSDLDVESEGSRIRGRIGVTVRPADLVLHSVDLAFVPLRSGLLRRISYDAVPGKVRGQLAGRLVAERGGPLTAFVVDRLEARFTDEALGVGHDQPVSNVTMSGTVGIGAEPRAAGLAVEDLRLDLRSLKPFLPDTLHVDGALGGRLFVRSADPAGLDVRDMQLVWTDSVHNVSSVSGHFVVRYDDPDDPKLTARVHLEPLSMRALARIDTTLPVRSLVAGRVSVDGKLSALDWQAHLSSVADNELVPALGDSALIWRPTLSLSGTASLGERNWRAAARGSFEQFDVRRWTGRSDMPLTALSGDLTAAGQGARGYRNPGKTDDTVATGKGAEVTADPVALPVDAISGEILTGHVSVRLGQDEAEGRPALTLVASASLDDRRLLVDSAMAELGGIRLEVRGGLGRDSLQSDTLMVSISTDSLDAARPAFTELAEMLKPVDSVSTDLLRDIAADTLQGDMSLSGYIIGNFADAEANVALGGRAMQVGAIRVGRLFGSLRAERVFTRPTFEGAATMDEITGIGAVRIQSATARVMDASPERGGLLLELGTDAGAQLVARGNFATDSATTAVTLDSVRLSYDDVVWRSVRSVVVSNDSAGLRLEPSELRSNVGGALVLEADVPVSGGVRGHLQLERFPVGEVATLLVGARLVEGTLSGRADLSGTRQSPLISWMVTGDSLGVGEFRLPSVVSNGSYDQERVSAEAVMRDSLGGAVRLTALVPIDLRLVSVEKRILSDELEGSLTADSLRLEALPIRLGGMSRQQGTLHGRLAIGGTFDRPNATGTMVMDEAGAYFEDLGINPRDGRMVLRANADSIVLESLRLQSGRSVGNMISAHGVVLMPVDAPMQIDVQLQANAFDVSHQRDGTDLEIGGMARIRGPLGHPTVSGNLLVPRGVIAVDPLGERIALDLTSPAARELLGEEEVPVAESAAQSLSALGSIITVENARVDLGEDVWVQTPEARVKLGGGLSVTMSGESLVLDGQITANRGQYRLELGPVVRGFSVDSGSVRFFPNPAMLPALDINATNVVRVAGGGEVPVKLHIGGGYDRPELTLSSTDPLYASAPESEIISLLIFGAPTFALDGQSQSTVRAVTGLLLPSVGGAVEGALQRILPGNFNTLQVSTAGNEAQASLSPTSLLDNLNLSITAGKQIGERTYLRLNTGVCRGSGQVAARGAQLWAGIAVEYRIAPGWLGQLGVDPGSAPCTRVGGADFPRMQFGFDLFRDWIF